MADANRSLFRLRPRFSLLTALMLTALVACGITIWQLWREVGPMREEVRRLRDEVGELSIEDPTKLHAIQVPTESELVWKWRVWIPQNKVFVVHCTGENIPAKGFPQQNRGSIWLRRSGEQVITYRIRRDPVRDRWEGRLEAISGSVGADHQPWVEWGTKTFVAEGVSHSTQSNEPGERMVLVRRRVSQATSSDDVEDPADGFMIWLEPGN